MITNKETKGIMNQEIRHIPLFSQTVSEWLTAHAIKRGAALYWATFLTMSAAIIHFVGMLKQPPQAGILVACLLISVFVQAIMAVTAFAFPGRRLLLIAALAEGLALLFWFVAHNLGLSDGSRLLRAETLGMSDLYLPLIEAVSAGLFLCLFGRTWSLAVLQGKWRTLPNLLPTLFVIVLLLLAVIEFRFTELGLVVFFLNAQFPTSLQYFFFPAVACLVVFLLLRLIVPSIRLSTKGAWRVGLILLPLLFVVNIVIWDGATSAASIVWLSPSVPAVAPFGQTTTLTYCNTSTGAPLAMDISEPSAQAKHPAPVVFYIHGGETLQGSRILLDGSLDGAYFTQLRNELVDRGFVVGSIDYGLSPLYHIPEEVRDAKCAVRFLRSYAKQLGIDPQHIGVYGPSQGGYLSAMLGTASPGAGYDTGQYLDQSSRVQAVVDMWGPTDLNNFSGSPSWVAALTQGSTPAGLRAASPVTYVAPNDPPFLIIHGVNDWFIAPHHSQDMAKRLQAAGVPVTLVMVQHDQHGLATPVTGQVEQPSPNTLVHMIVDFFARTLAA